MNKQWGFVAVLGLALGLLVSDARAQRGVGDPEGVARQAVRPEVVTLSGTLTEIRTTTCEQTTGRFGVGVHLILKTPEGKELNVHLGPAAVLQETVDRLSTGQPLTVQAFRTPKMPEDQYVAQTLSFDETTIRLRDEALRPVWAGPGRGRGFGAGAWGARRGPGRAPAWERGAGRRGGWY